VQAHAAKGKANLASTGLNACQVVSVLLAAARGAKYGHGAAVAPDAFRTSLQHIAHVFAAAIRGL